MALVSNVAVRQPSGNDVVDRSFTVAGCGAGFEGTIVVTVHDAQGSEVGRAVATSAAGGIGIGEFSVQVHLERPPGRGARLRVRASAGTGDDATPRPRDTDEVEVTCFPGARGWLLYRVDEGDTLTGVLRAVADLTTADLDDVLAANPRIKDADVIEVGWRLKLPLLD